MTDEFSDKLPKRPKEHVSGDRAIDVFRYRRKKEWAIPLESQKDYGWDILITLSKNERVKDDFFVQLKGHEEPDYVDDLKFVSEQIKVTTLRWLLMKPEPVMLCVCDIGNKDAEPIYFIWFQEAVTEIEKTNSNWERQEYVNIRIPTANIFDSSAHENIEEHVENYYTTLRINKAVGEIIAPASGQLTSEVLKTYRDKPDEYVIEKIAPLLEEVGLVDITSAGTDKEIEALSRQDRELFAKLNKVSTFLNVFNDIEASKLLLELDEEIGDAADGIQAKYLNCKGVLSLHFRNDEDAIAWLGKAYKLRPKDSKIATNYLLTLLIRHRYAEDKTVGTLPDNYLATLDEIIENNPAFWPAKRAKAYWLSAMITPEAAFDFLRSSSALEKDMVDSHICLADIYNEHGRVDDALETLKQIDVDKHDLGQSYYSIYAFLLFAKATGNLTAQKKMIIHGAGPSTLNLILLKDASNYYDKAYRLLWSKGFPKAFEETIINYSSVLDLLGYHQKAEEISKAYLDQHPESVRANAALATSLFKQHKYPQAVKHARIAFAGEPRSSTAFINLLLSLFLSEDHEGALQIVSNRIKEGFKSNHEEGVARTMAVLAYTELGLADEAEKQMKVMECKEELKIDVIITKASIEVNQQQKINIYRKGFVEFPDNERLLDQYLGELIPVKKDSAKEVLEVVTKIKEHRQLLPEEYYNLGHAYLLLNTPEKAEEVFRSSVDRYPSMQRFLFDHAITLYILGHEDKSYDELKRYIGEGKRDYSVLKNLAIVSENTGRTEEAIRFLSAALKKVTSDDEKGEIHCQLYELKRRKTFPPKDLLFHIVEYGKTTNSIPDLEARYLMLFMMAPEMLEYEKDPEVAAWVSDFRKRLKTFTTAYPNFNGLRVFSLPEAATGEQIRQDIMSTIAYMALPHDLATASIKIATRSGEWPTVFRAHYLYSKSIFDYWDYCIESKESQHAIHIWRPTNDLYVEATNAGEAHVVCIDITALLTLVQFDLLSALNKFEKIIMAWETRKAIEKEMHGFKPPNPGAKKIYDWEIKNKHKIRTRGIPDDSEEDYTQTASGLFMKTEKSIKKIFKDGIGETLLLAQELGFPLYSDESYIRSIGESTFKTKTFSTLGLLRCLEEKKYVQLRDETQILSQMIKRNYMIIPFTPFHLHSRLKDLLVQKKAEGKKYVKSEDMQKDEVMMPFLGQFADSILHNSMVRIALDWWLLLIDDTDIPDEQLAECMYYPIYSLSMQSKSTLLGRKIYEDEQEKRTAGISGLFLWHVYKKNAKLISKAWSAIKSSCARYFPGKEEKVIFSFLLSFLKKYIEKESNLSDAQKVTALFEISESIPFVDKAKFQEYFIKNKPAFIQ